MLQPASTDLHLWVTWEDYHRQIERLALIVHESGWQLDQILCLARGGLRPGDILSRVFEVPLAILSTSSYREEAGTRQGALDIARHITTNAGTIQGRLLLVDDLVDSGVTLQGVMRHLKEQYPQISEIRTAAIWQKACSTFTPDFVVEFLESNPWIHQPFEMYDAMRPTQLKERLS
jgi:hypoxanthine phosphoribosyltransferase